MFKAVLRAVSPVIRKRTLPVQYCACLKSTVADSEIIDSQNAKPFKDIPGPRGMYSIPLIGTALLLKPFGKYDGFTFHKLLDSLHDKYGPTFKMELFGATIVTANPDAIEEMFRNEGSVPKRTEVPLMNTYAERKNVTKSITNLNGPEWHRLRSAAQKYLLKVNSASVYIGAQIGVTNDLITRISTLKYTPEEFRDELFKYATESIGVVCFNKRLGFLDADNKPVTPEGERYLHAIKQFFELLPKDLGPPLYKIFPTKLYRDFERAADVAYGLGRKNIEEVLHQAKQEVEDGTFDPEKPNLILQLQANPKTTLGSVNAILLDLLTAGTDSTAKNMEMFLLNMALNPDKQQKLYEEILEVIGPKGNEMESQHLSKMMYFRACMKESFRKNFPLVAGTFRELPHDAVIDGYLVPKGTNLMNNSRRVCLDSQYFESPEKYEPERWLRDENNLKRERDIHPFSLMPFGMGKRICLGRRFAEQEIWLGVTKILQNFHVSVSEADKNFELIYTTFIQTKEPISFTFTPR